MFFRKNLVIAPSEVVPSLLLVALFLDSSPPKLRIRANEVTAEIRGAIGCIVQFGQIGILLNQSLLESRI